MKNLTSTLFLEINDTNIIFSVGENDQNNNLKIIHVSEVQAQGIENYGVSDLEKAFTTIKNNIYSIEQKFDFTFRDVILILDNFNPSFVNLSGFKMLNGSQILRENITYIINILKSYVDKIDSKKTILHIFNSKFFLDNKVLENLPIGLFGDFYSHELSFSLIKKNDFENLRTISEKCNLKIKKIYLKSFLKGVKILENNKNLVTFYKIKINRKNSKIFYFENNSLKFEQNFSFGSDMIIKDISKISSLKIDEIKMILDREEFSQEILDDEIIDKGFFKSSTYRKIKKKLIYEIAFARIEEILQIIVLKNINLSHYNKGKINVFLEINDEYKKSLKEIFKKIFFMNNFTNFSFLKEISNEDIIKTANKLVHFGWKKEAIPISQANKSLLARFFDALFD